MSNEIQISELDERSKVLVESGFFPDLKSVQQAKVKVWIGKSLGLSEFQALTGIYITAKGQIGLSAVVMGSMVKAGGKYDYMIEKLEDTVCSIKFFRVKGDSTELLGTSTFTDKDAIKCGLVNKDTYKSYPRNMLLARALANGCRWFCADAVSGCYAVEELDDFVPETKMHTIELTEDGEVKNG